MALFAAVFALAAAPFALSVNADLGIVGAFDNESEEDEYDHDDDDEDEEDDENIEDGFSVEDEPETY